MHDPETAPTGALYRLDPDGSCRRMVDGIVISNSLCWSPDGRTMYHADTMRRTVWAWDSDPERGEIANRRVFVTLSGDEGHPDGATVDSEGFVWLAHWDGWQLTRHDPTGRTERVIRLPVQRPTCPAFGGPDLDGAVRDLGDDRPLAGRARDPALGRRHSGSRPGRARPARSALHRLRSAPF